MFQEIDEIALLSSYKFLLEKEYWTNKLSGDIIGIDLAFDTRENPGPPVNVERADIIISADIACKLVKLSKKSDASLYILLSAALKLLIYFYTASEDIIVVSPLYKFNVTDETVNQRLFIRDTLHNDMTFKELVLNVRESTLKAYENQDYPSHKLLEYLYNSKEIQDPFTIIYNNILCALENIHDSTEVEKIINRLTFSFLREEEQVKGRILYDSSLYKKDYIEQITGHFVRVLEQAVNNIEGKIGNIAFLSDLEKKRLLEDFNPGDTEMPSYKTIHEMLEEQFKKRPENIAVISEGSDLRCSRLTYSGLNERANCLASILREKGVGPDTIIPLLVEPSQEMVIGIIAILKAGGCFLPLDPELPAKRVRFMLEDTGARILLTHSFLFDKTGFNGEILTIEENINRENIAKPEAVGSSKDALYTIYTSGTTGKPKGVLIKNSNLINYVHWFTKKVRLIPADKAILTSSFAFDLGYTALFTALLTGCELHILRKEAYLSAQRLLTYIEEKEITFLKITPSLFSLFVNSPGFSEDRLKTLRLVILGGEAIDLKDVEKVQTRCSHIEFMDEYGPTEATIGSIARFIDFNRVEDVKENPTIGKPINNTRAYILGKHLKLLPVGVPGELCLWGICLAKGYLNRPELTAERFTNYRSYRNYIPGKIYKTGDLARWLAEGNIEFLGRMDHQVKIRGYRIELGEIEKRLIKHDDIKEALVLIKEGGEAGKYLCAYIVPTFLVPGKKLAVSEIREYLLVELPEYMAPSYFVQIDSIPLTPNGKLNRKALPEPDGIGTGMAYIAPRNEREDKLVEIWAVVLNLDKKHIGIDDNFFEIGGHSLKVTGLIGRIHKAFNIEVPVSEVFNIPTIRGLASYINKTDETLYASIRHAEEREYYAASPVQKRLFALQYKKPEAVTYNITGIMSLEGRVHNFKFEESFKKIICRHESLRTSFEIIAGELVQKIQRVVDFKIEYFNEDAVIENFSRPFDPGMAPMFRFALIKKEEEKYILVIDMHHIIADGTSIGILIKEFMSFYAGEELPTLKFQYKDYSEWQGGDQQRESIIRQEKYWLTQFEGKIAALDLPTDFARPVIQSFQGSTTGFEIGIEETNALKALALKEGVTLYMLFLTIFNILLAKISRQEDIIVGTPLAGRRHVDLGHIIGMFVNTLALRNYPRGVKTFREFLKEVKESTIEAFENQDYQFGDLVEKVVLNRDMSRNPLFDVMFDFILADMDAGRAPEEITIPGLKIRQYKHENRTSKVDFIFMTGETDGRIYLRLEYCTELYKEETMNKWLTYFEKIIEIIIKDSQIKIKDIELIDEDENCEIRSRIQKDMEEINMNRNMDFDI